jgi:acetyl-CoA carboxylase carboxyltransferase component
MNNEHGKMSARERLEPLLDPESFHEVGMYMTHRAVRFGMDESHPYGDGEVTAQRGN